MMKKYLWLLITLIACPSWAAQQVIDPDTDTKYRTRWTKENANDTELYRLAHGSYSSLQEYDEGDIVTSSHTLYVSLQDNNTGHPVTDPAWWQEVQTGGGSAPVDSVFGRTGAVTAQASDYSAYYLALATCSTVGEVPTWNGSAFTCSIPSGSGDMAKSVYDTGDNGIVDNAEALLGGTWAAPGTAIGAGTPVAITGTTATFDTYNTSAADGSRYQLIWNTNDPSIICDAAHNGAFSYRRSDNSFRYCNGSAWSPWPGGSGSSANIVDTDPTSSSPTGEYWSRASGDLFYVVNDGGINDGIFQVAGTWTPDAVTYTLTVTDPGNGDSITCSDSDLSVAINCGNGNSDCSAMASNGASITGMTATAASGRQFDNWTGDITGSENPTTTALIMDSNKSVGAAFSASSSVLDDFNRADGALGANWTDSAHPVAVSNNQARSGNSNTFSFSSYTASTYNDNQWASALLPDGADYSGVTCRMDANFNGYAAIAVSNTSAAIYKIINGAIDSNLSGGAQTVSDVTGQIIKIECSGTTITGYIGTTQFSSITDSSFTSGSIGVTAYSDYKAGVDNFSGGNL